MPILLVWLLIPRGVHSSIFPLSLMSLIISVSSDVCFSTVSVIIASVRSGLKKFTWSKSVLSSYLAF